MPVDTAVRAFVADLPDLTPEQLASAYAWAKKKFEKSQIQRRDEGYTLAALCLEEKTVRKWQSLIRTNLQNWNVALPSAPVKGWLRALSADAYAAIQATPDASGEEPYETNRGACIGRNADADQAGLPQEVGNPAADASNTPCATRTRRLHSGDSGPPDEVVSPQAPRLPESIPKQIAALDTTTHARLRPPLNLLRCVAAY